MKNNKKKLAKEWFKKADNDILNVKNNLKFKKVPTDTLCFHSQQAVEKYLKGYLILQDIEFKLVHNLRYLNDLAVKNNIAFEKLYEITDGLNKYSVEIRYPYFYMPSLKEAKEAYKIAVYVRSFILKRI